MSIYVIKNDKVINKNNISILVVTLVLTVLSLSVEAEGKYTIYEMSDLDLTMLPPFCTPWARGKEAQTDAWVKKLQIPNIHHFCKGLNHVNHAVISTKKEDSYFNSKAGVSEFTYILEHAKGKGFPLKAFLLENRAKLFDMLDDKDKAISDYMQSISVNPKYTKSYVGLIDLYTRHGNKEKAIFYVNEGLKYAPESKLLLKTKKKLGQ